MFVTPTFEQIRQSFLDQLRQLQADAPIGSDSDNFVRATSLAAVMEQLYAHGSWVARQPFPDLADTDLMVRMANQRGIYRKPATAAAGTVQFTGTPGANVPLNTLVEAPAGATKSGLVQTYAVSQAGVIAAGGTVTLPALAVVPGQAGNLAAATAASMPAPPLNVASAQILTMADGVDAETDASLLDRLLSVLQNPPAGGNAADYERWAREVAGVARAFVYPLRRGNGTVDVVPLPATGLPSGGLLTAVQNYIDARRPVGMGVGGFQAVAPTGVDVDVTAVLVLAAGFLEADVIDAVEAALQAYFDTLAPGDSVIRSKIAAIISNTPGVADMTLSAPAANVPSTVSSMVLQLPQLGDVDLST